MPTMPGRVESDLRQPAVERAVMAVFHSLEVSPHAFAPPARIAGKLGDVVPIRVVGTNQDHGIVSGASTQCTGARIQHAIHMLALEVFEVLWIEPLLIVISIVTNKEIPLHSFVFRSKAMKSRYVVVVGQPIYIRLN